MEQFRLFHIISRKHKTMNAEIEKQIASIIEAAKSTGTDAVDFIKQQTPDYFAQLIKWYVWDGALDILKGMFWCGVSGCGIWLLTAVWRWRSEGADERTIGFAICAAVVLVASICSVMTVSGGITQIIKAKVAPTVIIADEIKSAIRGEAEDHE